MKNIKEMGILETCREFLLMLLRLVMGFYLFAILAVLPFYFQTATDYSSIGSDKSGFFRKWGVGAARLFVHILLFYLVFAAADWWVKNRKKKGKWTALLNRFIESLSLTDKFAILYGIGLILSYYYSYYRSALLMGMNGWYMGFVPQLVFLGSYFAVSRLLPSKSGKIIAGALLAVSFVVFLLGLLNRYGVNPLGMVSSGPSFISTIGNINWYCGYWAVLFPIGATLFVAYRKAPGESDKVFGWKRAGLGLFTAVGFATGITQGSESGMAALAVMLLFMGCLAGREKELTKHFVEMLFLFCLVLQVLSLVQSRWPDRNQYLTGGYLLLTQTWLPWVAGIGIFLYYLLLSSKKRQDAAYRLFRTGWRIAASAAGVVLVFFVILVVWNTLRPGSLGSLSANPLFTFDRDWGSARGGTWTAGIRTWASQNFLHKLLGVGPDGMWMHIYNGPDTGLLEAVRAQFGNNRLTNAHGEWITILANLGLLGLAGFAGMMVSAIVRFLQVRKGKALTGNREGNISAWAGSALCMACGMSLFCYTINNIFSFQQTMNVTQMFLVLGLGEAIMRRKKEDGESRDE